MLSPFMTRMKNAHISGVELIFVLILLIFGIPMILLIPPGAGYDEEDHLIRVWELSAFSLLPGQMSPQELRYPIMFRDLAYRQQANAGIIDKDFWRQNVGLSLSERGFVRRELVTKSAYSPALLLPQGITMWLLGRHADLPALPVFYACRFAGLLGYLLLVWLAIRLLPFGKWILLVLAVSPIALFQATTITADTISNGIGFLFIAGGLRLAESKEFGWRECGNLILLIFLLFLAKVNLVPLALLPFLLIPPSRFPKRGMYVFLIAMTGLLFMIEVAAWNVIAARGYEFQLSNEAMPGAQLLYILRHPFLFLQTLFQDLIKNGWAYVHGWINGYGYYFWTPPLVVSILFLLSLISVLWIDSRFAQMDRKYRLAFVLVFLAGYLATILSLYISFTPVGSDQILGVQGRYFLPLVLPLLLALFSVLVPKNVTGTASGWTIGFLAAALALNIIGIVLAFYVPCGTTFYQTGLCYQPFYKDFSGETRLSPPLPEGSSLTQEVTVSCNGFTELRVLLSPSAPGNGGSTRFLVEDTLSDETLLDTSVLNNKITEESWYPLRFDPAWGSAGNRYRLNILTGGGIRLLYTTQSEFNLGDFQENGQLLEEDIVLQYGCATGLRKLWLTGKP